MLSSSPSAKMHLIVPSGKLNFVRKEDLPDLFCSIWEMLFSLVVREFEDLQAIGECCLSRFCFGKVVHNFLIGICLFDVVVVEVNYGVPIWEHFSFNSIVEDNFLLTIFI